MPTAPGTAFLLAVTPAKSPLLSAEFSQLQDLEAYVKLPGDYPCTKIQTSYQKIIALKAEPFLLKAEKRREYAASNPANSDVPGGIEVLQPAEVLESTEEIPGNKETLV